MKKVEMFEAYNGVCFATEEECRQYELSSEEYIRDRFWDMAEEVDAEYLGIPYWSEDHTVYALIPKTESDIEILNAIGMIYSDNSRHNNYSSVYRNNTVTGLHCNGDNLFCIGDINDIILVEFGYGGGNYEHIFDSDYINVWGYKELMDRQCDAIHNLMKKVK